MPDTNEQMLAELRALRRAEERRRSIPRRFFWFTVRVLVVFALLFLILLGFSGHIQELMR